MREISPCDLKQLLDTPDGPLQLLDVREPWEVERVSLPHSHAIPMGQLVARLPELDPECTTVVLCHHGIRSRSAALYMERNFAFLDVRNLSGGIDAWAREIDPTLATY